MQRAALACSYMISCVETAFLTIFVCVCCPRVASQIENVDFSQPVVAEMCRTHSTARPRMTWRVMDVTDMSG